MPIYEYACEKCNHEFEVEQRITEDPVKTCPECRSRKVKRLISQTSFVLKGGGWYADLYSSKKAKDAKSKESGDKGDGGKGDGDKGDGGKGGTDDGGSGGSKTPSKPSKEKSKSGGSSSGSGGSKTSGKGAKAAA